MNTITSLPILSRVRVDAMSKCLSRNISTQTTNVSTATKVLPKPKPFKNKELKPTHAFNLSKWGIQEKLYHKVQEIFGVDLMTSNKVKFELLANEIPSIGDKVIVNGKEKFVIGYNGERVPHKLFDDPNGTRAKELFYGNLYVALKYAKVKTEDSCSFVRAVVADRLPDCNDHGEAWFEGNWKPLKRLDELGIDVVPILKCISIPIA